MNLLLKYGSRLSIQTGLFFFFSLLLILAAWQSSFTYTVNAGLGYNDSWELTRGWGDQEQNEHFSYRWTIDNLAEARLPDVGWPSQVRLVSLAPRPGNNPLEITLNAGGRPKLLELKLRIAVGRPINSGD
jgi:hypothetical protein